MATDSWRVLIPGRYAPTPPGAVRVMRPSWFGNPFRLEGSGSSWRVWWGGRRRGDPATCPPWFAEVRVADRAAAHLAAVGAYRRWLLEEDRAEPRARTELAGRLLGCSCPPGFFCHAEVLAEVANGECTPNNAANRIMESSYENTCMGKVHDHGQDS